MLRVWLSKKICWTEDRRERKEMGYICWADAYGLLPNADYSGTSALCEECEEEVASQVNAAQRHD
jgi:hypothetical protein